MIIEKLKEEINKLDIEDLLEITQFCEELSDVIEGEEYNKGEKVKKLG